MNFKKLTLSAKIAWIISVLLTLIFILFIGYTVLSTGSSLKTTISAELNAISKSNGLQVQQIIDTATMATNDMEHYLQAAYEMSNMGKRNMAGEDYKSNNLTAQEKLTHQSIIYNRKITELSSDCEKYIIFTAKNIAVSNDDIVAVGAMFEPYAYDDNIKDYAFLINEDIGDNPVKPYGAYETYCNEPFYADAKNTKKMVFTEPYLFDDTTLVSITIPIINNDHVMGILIADMNVTNFAKIDSSSERYPSMYASIYNQAGTIIYDSENMSNVGKNMSEFFGNKNQLTNVLDKFSEGNSFSVETTREDGSTVMQFFNPIKAGDEYWWTLTALDKIDMNKMTNKTAFILVAISVVALVLIVLIVIVVLRKMHHPIQAIVEAANQISNGNFDIHLTSKSEDEIGILTNAFNHTAKTLRKVIKDISTVLNEIANSNLKVSTSAEYVGDMVAIETSMNNIINTMNGIIGNINQSSEQVSSGSEQMSCNAQALAQGATEQASTIEELAATINEISNQISNNAESASYARASSLQASEEVQTSNQQMQEMIVAMNEISTKSNEINKIIKTIESIAFQTNILALNASIEATRAGVAGDGFAVVADEVRNLANKSADAAKTTTMLIGKTIHAVNNGIAIVDKAAHSMQAVVESSNHVTELVDEISHSSSEQAQSITQVTNGVEQISNIVQTNSAAAQESAAASEQLSSQAAILKQMVENFHLK